MKSIKQSIFVLVLMVQTTFQLQAQTNDYIRRVDLQSFNHIQLQVNTEVLLVRGSQNQIILQGETSAIDSIQIIEDEGILAMDYLNNDNGALSRVIIEYTDIQQLTTGGTGTYFITNLDEQSLHVLNPQATLYIQGKTDKLNLVSFDGTNDIRSLSAGDKLIQKGDLAQIID